MTELVSKLFARLDFARPFTPELAQRFGGISIGRKLGSGVFRDTYALIGYPDLVIKFPSDEPIEFYYDDGTPGESCSSPQKHIETEMFNVAFINKSARLRDLRPHMPTIYYYDKVSHVQVAKRCRPLKHNLETKESLALLTKYFKSLTGNHLDLGYGNVMRDENDRLIIVDLGYARIR